MGRNKIYAQRNWDRLLGLILEAIIEGDAKFSIHRGNTLVQNMADVIRLMPDRGILREHLLSSSGREYQKDFALFAEQIARQNTRENWRRIFFVQAQKRFDDYAIYFRNIIDCEEYIGTLESIYDWLALYPGKKISDIAESLPLNLSCKTSRKSYQT